MFQTAESAAALAATIHQATAHRNPIFERLCDIANAHAAVIRGAIHPDDPAAPEPEESQSFEAALGDIPVRVAYTETAAGVIVEGVAIGDGYAEASCFGAGQRAVWAAAIESRLERLAMGYVR